MYEGARFDPRSRHGHVESYFLKINDPEGARALWVKATILARKGASESAVAESWAVVFERGRAPIGAKTSVPYESARFSPNAIDVELPSLSLSRTRVRGSIGEVTLDLAIEDSSAPFIPFPHPRMYSGPFPSTKLTSPMPDLVARGEVRIANVGASGRVFRVDGWRGLLGHNWGRGHTFLYAWGHCNVWDERADVVFEGSSGRVRVGPLLTPMGTLLVVRIAGETHYLTRLNQIFRNRGSISFRRWRFSGAGPTLSVRGELWTDPADVAGLHYENPDGAMTYCLNSKLAFARLSLTPRGATPFVLSSRAAALEVGTRDPGHGNTMIL